MDSSRQLRVRVGPLQNPRPSSHTKPSSSHRRSSSKRICLYDVFISFRGSDTRNTFTDHLYNHLVRKGISTFKDDKMLEAGQPISLQLLEAIKDSRVSIIVFSKDYVGSTWCLEEMATIADCQNDLKQTVFPVFYDVDPSDVRKQSGVYGDAFSRHQQRFFNDPFRLYIWKRAMKDLANCVGYDVRNKPEFREIEKIVQAVIKSLDHKFSGHVDDLIGIQPRVHELENLLKLSSKDDGFKVLGIWGMGGIGKTTHATVLYDKISYLFDACCFIENLSQDYKTGGAIAVQKQILRQTLDEKNLETYSPSEISGIVKKRLHNIKVLFVFDNVDQLEQLQKLAIIPKLLCEGSRIIIATRDQHILKVYRADAIYKVPLLNDDDVRELFCTIAFKSDDPGSRFVKLIPEVLKYTQSLPLAVRVVGSFLCTRDPFQWRDALDRRKNNPDNQLMDVFRISFDGLIPDEKEIFLHVACFFIGERVEYVKRILDCCGLYPGIGIPIIIEKSLMTIRNQEIHMHEILQELGKKIVRDESFGDLGSQSRLWRCQDFHDVLKSEMGTKEIKAIVLDQKKDVSGHLHVEELSKLRGLKLLILYEMNCLGRLNFLSDRLHFLLWQGYPFTYLPSDFQSNKLVELNMPYSKIVRLWEGFKNLPCLKRLDLSNSINLVETPNFEGIPNLERLDFTGCKNLIKVHPSNGLLKKLAFLSFRNCSNLVSLNLISVSNLWSLRVLYLSGCTNLEDTPDFTGMPNLEYLDLEQCISLSTIHESIGALVKLKFLSLRHCINLVRIPNNVNTMSSLITLDLSNCLKLMNLPLVQRSELQDSYLETLISLDLGFCNLCDVPDAIGELWRILVTSDVALNIVIPGNIILKWFNHQFKRGSAIRILKADVDDNWIGFAFCVAFELNYHHQANFDSLHDSFSSPQAQSSTPSLSSPSPHPLYLSFESEKTEEIFRMPLDFDLEKCVGLEYLWVIYISQSHCHFVKTAAHITFKGRPGLEIKEWGLRMIFKQDIVVMNKDLNYEKEPPNKLRKIGDYGRLRFDYVCETQRWSNSWFKTQLPYNWLVTKEEEIENMGAKEKENNISMIGFGQTLLEPLPSSSSSPQT